MKRTLPVGKPRPTPDSLRAQFRGLAREAGEDGTVCFLSHHHRGGADTEARLLKVELCALLGLNRRNVFLDSDEEHLNVNALLEHVRRTKVLVLLLTKDTLTRPHEIGEVCCALGEGIPVATVRLTDGGYDFEKVSAFLNARDFAAELETQSKGSVEALRKQGIDVAKAGALLRDHLANVVATELNTKACVRVLAAQIKDIAEAIAIAAKRNPAKKKAPVLVTRKNAGDAPPHENVEVEPADPEEEEEENGGLLPRIASRTIKGELVRTLEGHSDTVPPVAFGPGGLQASGSWDKTIKLWER
jgi:hypothetical protein